MAEIYSINQSINQSFYNSGSGGAQNYKMRQCLDVLKSKYS